MAIEQLKKRFALQLVNWQKKYGRHDLPWQRTNEPYHVWLSEIMLQQTQVTTVIGYYERFLSRFPTLHSLARADLDEVLSLWSGLGYYARARNLHRCANMVMSDYDGAFPQTMQELIALPGIGRSTAAAIAAFCFCEPVSILDGNVKRVLTRVLAYGSDISTTAADKELWRIAQTLLPSTGADMPAYTQGLMDLGATLCLPKQARCAECPMQNMCKGHAQKNELAFPYKTKKLKRTTRLSYLLYLTSPLGVWLVKRPEKGVWGGIFSMPEFDERAKLDERIACFNVLEHSDFPMVKHVLTHFDWMLQPVHFVLTEESAQSLDSTHPDLEGQWYSYSQALKLGLPAPIKNLLKNR